MRDIGTVTVTVTVLLVGRYLPSPQDNTKNQSYLEVGGRARGMPCLRHCNVVTCSLHYYQYVTYSNCYLTAST